MTDEDDTPRLIVDHQFLRTEWSGGAGTYAEELVGRLDAGTPLEGVLGPHRLTVLNRPEEWDAAPLPRPPRTAALRRIATQWILPPGFHGAARNTYRLIRQPRQALRRQPRPAPAPQPVPPADFPWSTEAPCIFHELTSYEAHPLVGHATLGRNVRLCVTFLDLQDYFFPDFFPPEVITQRRRNYAFYKQYAALFFAISEYTKQTMVDLLGIDADRIIVTHLAGDDVEILDPEPAAEAAARSHGRYLIYPAKPWRHKNHATLIEALGRAAEPARAAGLRLLLTGGMSEAEKAGLMAQAQAAGAGDLLEILGFQPRAALQSLLRNAEMLIFPSLFEGFGMPVLEAQTLGCPVACSDTTSLPEVAGDAALLFDPLDAQAIARVITDAALGRVDREGLRRRGLDNIRRFTWDATFRATAEGYRRLLA